MNGVRSLPKALHPLADAEMIKWYRTAIRRTDLRTTTAPADSPVSVGSAHSGVETKKVERRHVEGSAKAARHDLD
jgi:hypothetical protein